MNTIHENLAQDLRIILKSPRIEAIALILILRPFGNSTHFPLNMNLLSGVTRNRRMTVLYHKAYCETKELRALSEEGLDPAFSYNRDFISDESLD